MLSFVNLSVFTPFYIMFYILLGFTYILFMMRSVRCSTACRAQPRAGTVLPWRSVPILVLKTPRLQSYICIMDTHWYTSFQVENRVTCGTTCVYVLCKTMTFVFYVWFKKVVYRKWNKYCTYCWPWYCNWGVSEDA